jgi:pimeloyl-ACP methyl ester carboxylesterase
MERSSWQEFDWRTHQRWVSLPGATVNVVELGDGPTLLFIHGLGGCWHNWLEQLPVFAASHHVVAFDLPGFGDSPMPLERISISSYVGMTQELLEVLGVPSAVVVGNSMGGLIAAELSLSSPEQVERLALVSPAGLTLERAQDPVPVLRRLYPIVSASGSWLSAHADQVARRSRLREGLLATVAAHPEQIPPALAAEQLRGMGKPGLWAAFEDLVTHSIRERLGDIGCPTLIVWGAKDHVLPVRHADIFAASIPDSHLVVYADTGHVAMLERPEEFNALLTWFLSDTAVGAERYVPAGVQSASPSR